MNKSIIREMLLGRIGSDELFKFSNSHENAKKKMFDITDEFLKGLTEEQQEFFNKVFECTCDKEWEFAVDYYRQGFKFGLLLGMEISDIELEDI